MSTTLATFGKAAREAIDEAAQFGDADTADVFTEISRETDKQLWLVEAHLYSYPAGQTALAGWHKHHSTSLPCTPPQWAEPRLPNTQSSPVGRYLSAGGAAHTAVYRPRGCAQASHLEYGSPIRAPYCCYD